MPQGDGLTGAKPADLSALLLAALADVASLSRPAPSAVQLADPAARVLLVNPVSLPRLAVRGRARAHQNRKKP